MYAQTNDEIVHEVSFALEDDAYLWDVTVSVFSDGSCWLSLDTDDRWGPTWDEIELDEPPTLAQIEGIIEDRMEAAWEAWNERRTSYAY